MSSQKSSWQIKDIGELKVILQDIGDENRISRLSEQLQEYLQYGQEIVQRLAHHCLQQLTRKQQHIQNLIEFSLHMLQQIQHKSQQLILAEERVQYLQENLNKVNAYNMQLVRRLEDMEEQNSQYMKRQEENNEMISMIEQTRSLLLERLSYQQARDNKYGVEDLYLFEGKGGLKLNKRNSINSNSKNNEYHRDSYMYKSNINTFNTNEYNINPSNNINYSNPRPIAYTQRPSLPQQKQSLFITIQQHEQKLSIYQSSIQNKQHQITHLSNQLNLLKSQISSLGNQLLLKESELELSQIYFKEKLDIVQRQRKDEERGQRFVSQVDVKAAFRRELARVESVESIQSVNRSEFSQDPFSNVTDLIKEEYAHHIDHHRNPHFRRSLMQQFFTDFMLQAQQSQPVYSSQIIHTEPFSENDNQEGSQKKKTISVSTTDIKKMLSKGVQTINNDDRVIVRKTQGNKYVNNKDKLQESFLESITSMFTKKPQNKMKTINKSFLKQQSKDNKQASFFDSSIGTMFKGIFDYATKKIVTNRIQKKKSYHHNGSLNQSVLEELKPTKKTGYYKGMKFY